MSISGINATDPVSMAPMRGTQKVDKDAFMQLLVAKLEHQDPLNPTENEDFLSQLATFTSLEEMEEMNTNLMAMMTMNKSNAMLSQMTQSSALIGKTINWTDPETGSMKNGSVDSVIIEDGMAMLRVDDEEVPLGAVNEILGEMMDMEDMNMEDMDMGDMDTAMKMGTGAEMSTMMGRNSEAMLADETKVES